MSASPAAIENERAQAETDRTRAEVACCDANTQRIKAETIAEYMLALQRVAFAVASLIAAGAVHRLWG